MSNSSAGFQITEATFEVFPPGGGGSTVYALGTPAAAKVRELAEYLPIRAGTLHGPAALALIAQGIEADIATLDLDDNIAPGSKGTLTLKVKHATGGTAIIAITGMKRGQAERGLTDAPHTRRLFFQHEGAMAASPLSITV